MLKNWTYYTMSNINCDCKLLAAFLTASINSYLLRSTFFYVIQGASLRGRHPPPATLAQEGKIVWSGKGAMVDCTGKLTTWKCQEARNHTPGKQPRRHTHEYTSKYTAYVPGILLYYLRCIHTPVSKLVTTNLFCRLTWRIGTDTGCAGLVLAACR